MTELDEALTRLTAHEGVEGVLLVGRDGLLIEQAGEPASFPADTVAAMVPALAGAGDALGEAAGRGGLSTAVLELERGVALVADLSADALLAVFVRPGVGFAPLLRALRRERDGLARLL